MSLVVRRAVSTDAPVITEFNRLMAHETEGKTLDPAVLAAGVAAGLSDPAKGIYFVAEEGADVLGQMMITFEWSDWRNGWFWWIQSVYVRPDARRRGVFRALYDHVLQAARREPDVIGLRLYVEHENQAAQQTYLRLGMQWTSYRMLETYPLK
jgi:ribosomal protein S18 acetylase RimI-like enzyme